jgi:sugar lactone lactonase YvrE
MVNESSAYLCRWMRAGLLGLLGMLSLCVGAAAQQPKETVTSGSVIPLQHAAFDQIYQVLTNPAGDTIFLDVAAGNGELYQLDPGSTTFHTITTAIDPSGTYFNEYMAMDAKGTLYITDRYGANHLYRIPYNPADGTYDYNEAGDAFDAGLDTGYPSGSSGPGYGTLGIAFLNSSLNDGSGLLFVSQEQTHDIMVIPVSANGTVPVFPSGPNAGNPEYQIIIGGLEDRVLPMTVDVNGNLYFIEGPYDAPTMRQTGVFFIPASAYTSCMASSAAGTTSPATPCISGTESSLQRIDSGNPEKFNGLTLDQAGNVYVSDASDGYGGTRNGLLMIPNESGSPIGVTAASFNFNDVEYLSPAPVNAMPTIDPRGFIWLTTATSGNWSPNGSGPIPGTGNLILYQLGSATAGATPVGTPSATGTVFYTFSGTVTPSSLGFSQPGGGTDFSAVTTNPYPVAAGGTSAVPCGTSTTSTPPTYNAFDSCEYWFALNPQGANSVGQVSGQLSMLNSTGAAIPGSTAFLSGVGEGPAVALLSPTQQTPLATGLKTPQQVAGDSLGNTYVADSGLGQVLMFPTGSTTPTAGTPIGTGLTAPTGVAVDGAGDVYIGDSGKIIEVPTVNGTLNPKGQTTLLSGLGPNLNLAVDNAQNVYAADPSNGRVVKVSNPQMSMLIEGINTVGTFTKPTAVATDNNGNLYVADGTNLDELTYWDLLPNVPVTPVISSLSAPVTGLAVDPSGSVDVAQAGGVIRIPLAATGLQYNDASQIDNGGVTNPSGIGLDGLGNLYVTAPSYNITSYSSTAAPTATTVTTPSLLSLAGANVSFGVVSTQTTSNPSDIDVFNIGNENLAFAGAGSGTGPTFSNQDFMVEQDGQTPCDTTGATPIAPASSCSLGVVVTASANGLDQGSVTIPTTAINAPSSTGTLEAYAENNLCLTTTTITLSQTTGLVYPASLTVTAVTTPVNPSCSAVAGAMPNGGNIVLTLDPQAKGSSETTQTETLNQGNATFNLTGLSGGTYILFVSYRGDTIFGGSSSSRTFSFVVAPAMPTVVLNTPTGIAPVNGTYYVSEGSSTTLVASVTSPVGTPTGSVEILNNGSAPADATQNPLTLSGTGTVTFNTTNLAAGTYNLTAVFSGDGNYASVTSSVVTIVVIPPSALITANPTSLTTKAGTPVTSTLTITALEGYSPTLGVQLYCANLPQYAECTFDVPTINIIANPGVPQTSHVTISSNLPVNVGELRTGRTSTIAYAGMFGLGILGFAMRRRAKRYRSLLTMCCLLLLFAGATAGLTGCTNSGYSHTPKSPVVTTPSGTYQVSIYTLDLDSNQVSSLPFTLSVTIQ